MADTCGLGPCFRPAWLQRFATPRFFLIVYGLLGTIQAMAYIYFVATLTTLEKRFKIPSKTTGLRQTAAKTESEEKNYFTPKNKRMPIQSRVLIWSTSSNVCKSLISLVPRIITDTTKRKGKSWLGVSTIFLLVMNNVQEKYCIFVASIKWRRNRQHKGFFFSNKGVLLIQMAYKLDNVRNISAGLIFTQSAINIRKFQIHHRGTDTWKLGQGDAINIQDLLSWGPYSDTVWYNKMVQGGTVEIQLIMWCSIYC